jgi:hypothetical protein
MTDYFYETKESTADRFRAVVVTPFEDGIGRVDFVTLDDEHHVISLEDLAFLVRAARSLPRELFEPISMYPVVQPQAVAVPASDTKVERPERAGAAGPRQKKSKCRDILKAAWKLLTFSS